MLHHLEIRPSGHEPGPNIVQEPLVSDRVHPLEIPEILCLLVEYFDQQTILDVAKVSRAWRTIFSPYFWKDVHLDMTIPERRPPLIVVQQNSGIIRSLQLRCRDTVVLNHPTIGFGAIPSACNFPTCVKLSKLTIQKMGYDDDDKSLSKLIIQHSELLTSVSVIASIDPPESSSDLLKALATCTNLRRLEYIGMRLTEPSEWMTLYQTLWSRLDVLVLSGDWHSPKTFRDLAPIVRAEETEAVLQKKVLPSRIQDLTIEGTNLYASKVEAQNWIIEQSSATLTRLRWNFKSFVLGSELHSPMMWLNEMSAKGLFPKLETLQMPGMYFSLSRFAELVKRMSRLTEIDLSDSNFANSSWSALQLQPRHLSTIRVMHLEQCLELAGSSIQQMLCSMVNLVSFKAGRLYDTDIIGDPRPWVCRDLKELVLTIVLMSSPYPQRMIQSRLASLVKLEICHLNRPLKESFRMTLQSGLDRLGKLRQMKRFHVQNYEDALWAVWKEEEVKWVLKNWPFLEELSGVILSAPARQLLDRHGVRYTSTSFTS